jgi:hypothetical protein
VTDLRIGYQLVDEIRINLAELVAEFAAMLSAQDGYGAGRKITALP